MKLCGFEVGLDQPIFLIAGPCVIESEQLAMDTAGFLKEVTQKLGINFIFKSSSPRLKMPIVFLSFKTLSNANAFLLLSE